MSDKVLVRVNGAGKTTLLKMLNGLIKPDRGTITMRGRVGPVEYAEDSTGERALIALGTGFHPELTGPSEVGFALHGSRREPEGWEACRTRRLGKPLGRLPLAARRVR